MSEHRIPPMFQGRLQEWLQTPRRALAVAVLLLVVVAVADGITGSELRLTFLYVGPVMLAAWYAGRREALALALAGGIACGVVDFEGPLIYSHPFFLLWEAFVALAFLLLFSRVTSDLRDAYGRLDLLARTDALTGLPNRLAFFESAEREIARMERTRRPLSVVHIDLDGFKLVNDTAGHPEGDAVLRSVAFVLLAGRKTDFTARMGGDEFVVLMPETDASFARIAATRQQDQLVAEMQRHGWTVTFSIGIATFDEAPGSPDALISAADEAMYDAKRRGKNGIQQLIVRSRALSDPRSPCSLGVAGEVEPAIRGASRG